MTTSDHPAGIRVLLVDDHDLFRTGLRALLEEEDDLEIDDAPGGQAALQKVRMGAPDVVVMDLNMPGMSGAEATRRLREMAPGTAVLMLTVAADDDNVIEAVVAGASGYLLKDAELHEIVAGIPPPRPRPSPLTPPPAGGPPPPARPTP